LILPGLLGIAGLLAPPAAACFAVVLVGAIMFHRKHPNPCGNDALWIALIPPVAALRMGPYSLD
jgi:uncharacterized membrane protein YphA (DoxX/SURF4 family)